MASKFNLRPWILGMALASFAMPILGQIDFTPGVQYVYHRGNANKVNQHKTVNYSHQFSGTFGFRKHWKSKRFPYLNPYFGYTDIQQYLVSENKLEGNSTFHEISSIKQRGAFIGFGIDYKLSNAVMLEIRPEFMMLSSGDKPTTESYKSSLGDATVHTSITYKADDIELSQVKPLYIGLVHGGIKYNFSRLELGLFYRFMCVNAYGYNKLLWYSTKDKNTGKVVNNNSIFAYKVRLNGIGINLRYYFLDWNH
ncbi:MAG: hypothetical protein IT244_11945 [Bacteroidia bacterium]|nr:hypothetical protein [Bacteroidia bacterium]